MKVLLIQPPIEDFYDTKIRTYPLPLIYLATKIKDICDVTVIDFRTNKKPRAMPEHPFPEVNKYYREDIYTPLSLFSKYCRFGESSEDIKKNIMVNKPDVVAVSSLFTTYAGEALEIAKIAKEVNNGIITIMGGTHPTLFPGLVLRDPHVDYVIRGEGETPLFHIIHLLETGRQKAADRIPGVCSKKEAGSLHISEIHIEKDINLVPDRGFLRPNNYRIGKKNYTFFLTSRGCPFHCSFCGKPPVPYRKRSLTSVENELKDCINRDIQAIDFEDDMLTYDTILFNQILELLKGKGLTLSAMNGIYAETLNTETLDSMYEAGFRRLNFSLVDIGSPVLKRQKRHLPSRFLQFLPYLESSPFLTETHFIIGLPEQKPEDVIETLIFLMGKRLLPGPSVFYLAPGSQLFEKYSNGTWAKRVKSLRSSCMMELNPLFQRNTIYTFMKLTRFINFIKHCLDKEPSLKKLSDLPDTLSIGKEHPDRYILAALLLEKRLIHYNIRQNTFADEPQDSNLLDAFFSKARGTLIRGYKTMNSLMVDV